MAMRARLAHDFMRYTMLGGANTNWSLQLVTSDFDPLQQYIDEGLFSTWTAATEYNAGDVVNFTDAGGPGTEEYYEATFDGGYSSDAPGDMSGQWTTNPGDKITEQNVTGNPAQVWRYLGPRSFLPTLFNLYSDTEDGGVQRFHGWPSANTWQPSTSYSLFTPQSCVPTVSNGHMYALVEAGVSDSSEPDWSLYNPGDVITDLDAKWLDLGYHPGAFSYFIDGPDNHTRFGSDVNVASGSLAGASHIVVTHKEAALFGVLGWSDTFTTTNLKYGYICSTGQDFVSGYDNNFFFNCPVLAQIDLDDAETDIILTADKPTMRYITPIPGVFNLEASMSTPNNGTIFTVEIAWY